MASLIENLYSKLKLVLVRKDEHKSAALRAHLARIDALLERRGTRYEDKTHRHINALHKDTFSPARIFVFIKKKILLIKLPFITLNIRIFYRFLTGDTMCCFDCELMPRLQHIRVAGKYFVDFEIPVSH